MSVPCEFCPKLCHHACPVGDVTRDEALNTWGKVNTLRDIDKKILPESTENYASAYQCVQCHASETACEIDTPATDILAKYRHQAFQRGFAPPSIRAHVSAFSETRFHWDAEPMKKGDVVFVPSFDHNHANDPAFEARAKKILKLFEKLGMKGVALFESPLPCCGYPYYAAGDLKSFAKHAKHQARLLRRFRTVVSDSAVCLRTFETYYAEQKIALPARFSHLSEFLAEFSAKNPLPSARNRRKKIAYHDPCFLGRHRGVYEAPRLLIEKTSGAAPIEFRRHRESSYCCGGGGLYPVFAPEASSAMARNRWEEFLETGADLLVTGCSSCASRLRMVNKDPDFEVLDLVDYLLS